MPSLTISIYEAVLSSREVLEGYLQRQLLEGREVESKAFVTVRRRTEYRPDYAYKNEMRRVFGNNPSTSHIISTAVNDIAEEYVRYDGNRFVIPLGKFGEWQEIITRVSPLLVMAQAAIQRCETDCYGTAEDFFLEQITYSSLPEMDHRLLRDTLAKRGLAELHMHLNGTTEADKVWLDALLAPKPFARSLRDAMAGNIMEQLEQNGHVLTTVPQIYLALRLAAQLRYMLVQALFNDTYPSQREIVRICDRGAFEEDIVSGSLPSEHPISLTQEGEEYDTPMQQEGRFLIKALQALKDDDPRIAAMLHCYLLIQSCFTGLLIQQRNQSGFDQFQRIADNKLRDPSEEQYEYRFNQLKRHQPSEQKFIEGRFAPKKTIAKNVKLLSNIVEGWKGSEGIIDKNINLNVVAKALSLTAHFIKMKDKDSAPLFRHHSLRRITFKNAIRLCLALKANEKLSPFVTSADAAANELHASPEVFAPTFRFLRAKGWKRFTFHVGEDFHHLVSGLRAIWEAVTFLEFSSGDRIGHGTALGIDPELWIERLGPHVTVSRQEWLDTLLFVYELLRNDPEYAPYAAQFADEARQHAVKLYSGQRPSLVQLVNAWKMRHLDPWVAFDSRRGQEIPISQWREHEENLVRRALFEPGAEHSFELFERYHTDVELRGHSDSLISVATDQIPSVLITVLQRKVIDLLNKKQVAMEVMPTSNVRISYYQDHSEHHLFRLLGCNNGEKHPIGACPTICIASDDPGIFATCLSNEYAHVYKQLVEKGKTEQEALVEIERLVDNGWAFRFASE
ncbi:hypothetical protein [Halodesulfovibrio sp.]|uniref:hypothetical protein n=1 Tax=Halodesulfovibrio sp. TaxID=1912772 RepID=UPI0025BB18A8|nr:hypothetical protein [Halodesulfovibrio sp.]